MKLTVFTPTYNRAYSLTRLYESLKRQTDMSFEWLIVDDGSTDGTEELIQKFISQQNKFTIRYYKQKHSGKPSAQNMAVDLADGDFFITCDSNKYMDDCGVERILKMAKSIQTEPMLCGVGGYRANFSGEIYGGEMLIGDADFIDCSNIDREKYNLLGDKSTAFRTSILRQYKSPIFQGETFITEAVWLIPMACAGYKIRWFPKIICYGEYEKNGLTAQGANSYKGHYDNFLGYLAYINVAIKAYGYDKVQYLVNEALDIAKKKQMPFKELAIRIGFTSNQLRMMVFKNKILRCYSIFLFFKRKVRKILKK